MAPRLGHESLNWELIAATAWEKEGVIIAIYESSGRCGAVTFPLEVKGSPFLAICEVGGCPP